MLLMLQKFDPTRFTFRQDWPDGTQAPKHTPQVPLDHLSALLTTDPVKLDERKDRPK